MQLRFVELFCDVVQLSSFSKAALAHSVSQSSASQAVHQLEKELGTLLIDRSKRPFELTPAGEVYYEGCRELLESYHRVQSRVLQMRDTVVGPVRVAAIYSVGLLQMDCFVKRFGELYRDARLRLEYVHPDQVYAQVLNDEADIGLVSFPRDRGEFTSVPWQEQPMVLVVPPGHRLAGRESVTAGELDDEAYIGFTPELPIRKEIDRWFKRSKISVRIVHEFDNIENIKRAIEVGSGVAVLPLPTVRREADSGSLSIVAFSDVQWRRPLGVVHKRHKVLSNAVLKFVEMLRQDPASFVSGDATFVPGVACEAATATAPAASREAHSAMPVTGAEAETGMTGAAATDGTARRDKERKQRLANQA